MKIKNLKPMIVVCTLLFLCYILYMSKLLFFRGYTMPRYSINIVPFTTIIEGINNLYNKDINSYIVIRNFLGNIILFIPLGFSLALFFKKKNTKALILMIILIIFGVELTQLLFKVGCFDIDDIILNTFGGYLGILAFYITKKLVQY